MITNRKLLREAIHKEMFDVVKGWGVWLETIEITGVQICSNALFKDLQTNYREKMRQEATLFQMQVKQEIDQVRTENDLKVQEKEREINEKEKIYCDQVEMEKKESREKYLGELAEIGKEREKIQMEAELYKT